MNGPTTNSRIGMNKQRSQRRNGGSADAGQGVRSRRDDRTSFIDKNSSKSRNSRGRVGTQLSEGVAGIGADVVVTVFESIDQDRNGSRTGLGESVRGSAGKQNVTIGKQLAKDRNSGLSVGAHRLQRLKSRVLVGNKPGLIKNSPQRFFHELGSHIGGRLADSCH